jgi:phasin
MNVMTETANTATEANTGKRSASPFGLPKGAMPKFDPPKMEVPAAFRELAQKSVAQAKDNYEKIQTAADEITSILEQTYATAAKGVADYNLKLVEMARANSNAAFEFACGLVAMKSLPEMVELSTEQARKHFDLATAQNKELWALAERMAAESAKPISQSVSKAFNRSA